MPRLATNNPTERILRLLDDFEQVEAALDTVLQAVASQAPDLFASLPPKPFCEAVIQERLRQQLTSGQTRSKRQVMQRLRQNPESRSRREHVRPNAWTEPNEYTMAVLPPEQMEALAKATAPEAVQPEDLTDLQLETKKP